LTEETVEGDASDVASGRSLGRTSFDKREFLLPEMADLACDHLAEAGVIGDLNTLFCGSSGRREENCGGVHGDMLTEEGDSVVEGTFVDSPTQPGTLSVTTSPSYSKPELLCTIGRPSPLFIGFQDSLNWGFSDGEPMLDDETEAPDSDDAERMGGCSKECEAELGEP
jgi:hypothetical protein